MCAMGGSRQVLTKHICYTEHVKKFLIVILFCLILAGCSLFYFFNTYHTYNLPSKAPLDQPLSTTVIDTATTTPHADVGAKAPKPLPFQLAEGFVMSVFANGITDARVIALDPHGTMLVSEPSLGKIVALPDQDGNGIADKIVTVATGLNKPHGMAFRCTNATTPDVCALYVAETDKLSIFQYDATSMKASSPTKLLDLPTNGLNMHFTRSLLFMPAPQENTLLISVGSSCNVCNEDNGMRAKILAYDITTKKMEEFAHGVRNSAFMQIHPVTGAIFATENGRDGLGNDVPPDEVNIIQKGKNYGWPNCYGKNIHDTLFDKNTYIRNPCMDPLETPSYIDLQAHSAPLGLAFVPEEDWPEEYWHNLFVAYHGSWNREIPTGYKIVRIKLDAQGNVLKDSHPADFITGWLRSDGKRIGRPVDIKIFPGGVMYVSDDQAGVIYRIIKK